MSTRDASQFSMSWKSNAVTSLFITGYTRLIYRPVSTASADQFAIDEKVIRINGNDCWLYGAVDPKTSEILQFRLFPTMMKQTTRWFLARLHRRYRLDTVEFLVDDADHLVNILDEDDYRFRMVPHGNRNATERVFCEIERRTSLFANSFNPCRVVDSRIVAASPCRPAQLMPKLTRPTHYGAHIHHTNGGAEGDS